MSANDLKRRSDNSSSPMARMTKNTKNPRMAYTSRIEVPDSAITLPEPMNRPVPMAPPMEIS
ncbi:hypothetical protein D3C74_499030 [compost metagenome]